MLEGRWGIVALHSGGLPRRNGASNASLGTRTDAHGLEAPRSPSSNLNPWRAPWSSRPLVCTLEVAEMHTRETREGLCPLWSRPSFFVVFFIKLESFAILKVVRKTQTVCCFAWGSESRNSSQAISKRISSEATRENMSDIH